jgi:RNA polymerase sigma-70 factor (ECF subfamily)
MAGDTQGEVTKLLVAIGAGSEETKNRLFELVYEELHRIANGLMGREREDHTLQPTALVNEAYLKLFAGKELKVGNRAYFFAAAANAMRQVLVDHAIKRKAKIHGGDLHRVPIDAVLDWLENTQQVDMLALHEALERLEEFGKRQHEAIMLRFFGGLTYEEVAEHLNVSVSTVEKDWQPARAWLHGQLRGRNNDA